jgi:hypothetical protein
LASAPGDRTAAEKASGNLDHDDAPTKAFEPSLFVWRR